MSTTTRLATIAMLALSLTAATALAQQATEVPATTTAPSTTTPTTSTSVNTASTTANTDPAEESAEEASNPNGEIPRQFAQLLRRHPDELSSVLAIDPTLLTDETYIARYPDVASFVAAHPEIKRNPAYYLQEFGRPAQTRSAAEQVVENLTVISSIALVVFALSWLVRTIIDQKRWNRLSRSQSEVHNKILDRFGSSEELLQYIRTPAGARFLESAPIPLHTIQPAHRAPMTRILWSVQLGTVVAAAAIGMLFVSLRYDGESGRELFSMGMIALSIGAGFIASAAVSLFLSRRLGLWQQPAATVAEGLDEPGLVR